MVPVFAIFFFDWWTTALAGGAAVSVPIIIHLLNRRRFRVVTWAAMRFLLAAQKKNSRKMRIEQLLLLLVRCLVVLLLVLAMASVTDWAEKAWAGLFPNAAREVVSTSQRTHKILVLDGSFSLGAREGDETVFDRAKAMATRIVNEGGGGDGFSVVLMGSPPRRVVPEPSEDKRRVAAEIETLRLPHGNADVGATLNAVESLLRASPGKFPAKEVYFITDLQQSTWVVREPGPLAGVLQEIQKKAQPVFVDVGKADLSNVAVTGLVLDEPLAGTRGESLFRVTLRSFGPEAPREARVGWSVSRARVGANDPPSDPRNLAGEDKVTLDRTRETPFTFKHAFREPGDYLVQVRLLDPDALELDDTRSIVVSVRKEVPVVLVNGKPAPLLFDRATEFLRTALDNAGVGTGKALIKPRVLTETQFADEGLGDLGGTDCVFVCDVPRLSAAEVRRLEAHVRRGGGVVFCMGERVDLGAYNELLYKNGAGLLPARLIARQKATEGYLYQFGWEKEAEREPPLRDMEKARDNLLKPRIAEFVQTEPAGKAGPLKVLSLQPTAARTSGERPVGATAAPPPEGPGLLLWRPAAGRDRRGSDDAGVGRMRGRVALLTTTVNSDWGNWPSFPSFTVLANELLYTVSAGRLREQAVEVGDPLEEFLPAASANVEVSLATPEGRTESLRTQALDDGSVFRWADTDASGVYRATFGQSPREHLFAVNVPGPTLQSGEGGESNLARTDQDELQTKMPEWDVQVVADPRNVVRSGPHHVEYVLQALGTSIARWLLLAALALLFVEVVLAWLFGHYSATSGGYAGEEAKPSQRYAVWRWVLAAMPWVLFTVALLVAVVLVHDAVTGDFLGFLPDTFRSGVEQLAGVPPPAEGEGSRWRLEYNSFLWDTATDPWLAGLIAVAAVVLVVMVYRREGPATVEGQPNPRRGRPLLMGLRVSLFLLALVVLLPQVRLFFERQSWPDVVILIDDSQSMSAVDKYRDARIQDAVAQLSRIGASAEPDRLKLAQTLLTRSDPDWLTTLLTKRQVRLHVYHCSARAHRMRDVTSIEDVGDAVEAIKDLKATPENDSSQLGASIRQVLNDFRGSSLAAVIMLTDGVTTEGEDIDKAGKYAAQMGVPLYFVGLGDAHELRDLYLHNLQVADTVFVNDRVVFEMKLTAQGLPAATVPVTLHEKGKDAELARQNVRVEPGKEVKVRFIHQPTEPGEKVYEIKVPEQPDEVDKENNRAERTVFVREAKLIKVLYIEGYRRYEYHYLKTLLERESDKAKGNKSIDLKVHLVEADPDFATQDRTALADWPTKTELKEYDVVILGDVNPRPAENAVKVTEHLKDLADFVSGDHGGGLLLLPGERYMPHAYKDSPLKDVLPIDVLTDNPPAEPEDGRTKSYRPELTALGRVHPIFRFSHDEKDNDEIWNRLKEMYWYSEGYVPKRAAEVLAVHPTVKRLADKDGAARDALASDRHPLVVQQFVGKGRSLFVGFNETWRWGHREDQQHYNTFWLQAVRYLSRSRVGRVELRLDRDTPYRRGDPIKVTVRFPDDAPAPPKDTAVEVSVERRLPGKGADSGDKRRLKLAYVEGSRATFENTLTTTPEGEYRFVLTEPRVTDAKSGAKGPPKAECRVLAPEGEMQRLRMNQQEMERAAEESRGKFYSLADADKLLEELPPGSRISVNAPGEPTRIWNHSLVFLAALLLLSTEWIMRKQQNLL